MDEGLAIIIAALLATIGIYYTAQQQRRMLRRQHTFQIIEKLNHFDELEQNLKIVLKCVEQNEIPDCTSLDNESEKICYSIDFIFNYYEFLAGAILGGEIAEELAYSTERSRFVRYFLYFMPYVCQNRLTRQDESMWENLQFIVFRWKCDYPVGFDRALEQIAGKPLIPLYETIRKKMWEELLALRRSEFPNSPISI